LTVSDMADQCPLCERPKKSSSDYCNLHKAAFTNLENAYSSWSKAYGKLTNDEYFAKLENLGETGRAVKNLIRHLRKKGAVA